MNIDLGKDPISLLLKFSKLLNYFNLTLLK